TGYHRIKIAGMKDVCNEMLKNTFHTLTINFYNTNDMKEALYLKKKSALLKTRSIPYLVLLFLTIALTTACDKNDPASEKEEEIPTDEKMFNRLILVKNFGVQLPEGDEPTDAQSPLYYSLEQNQAISADHQGSNRWDLSFSEINRSFINCNNASAGYGK